MTESITNWIKHPLKLEGDKVRLVPLEEKHFSELIRIAENEIIWTYMPVKGTDGEKLTADLKEALLLKEKGEQYPFVVIEKTTQKIIGSTRYLKLNEEHRNLEIGWTWYAPDYWGKAYNEECKLLLLRHCFKTLKIIRVQITAAEKNTRSRKAIERVGAKFEGVLRNLVIRNGEKRNAAFYSIIEEEWPSVEANLKELIKIRTVA